MSRDYLPVAELYDRIRYARSLIALNDPRYVANVERITSSCVNGCGLYKPAYKKVRAEVERLSAEVSRWEQEMSMKFPNQPYTITIDTADDRQWIC